MLLLCLKFFFNIYCVWGFFFFFGPTFFLLGVIFFFNGRGGFYLLSQLLFSPFLKIKVYNLELLEILFLTLKYSSC